MIIAKLKVEVAELQKKIAEIQRLCSHPVSARTMSSGGSTGNWDRSQDCYWVDHHCQLCDKQWREDK